METLAPFSPNSLTARSISAIAFLPLPRIDAGEADELFGIAPDDGRYFIIGQRCQAGCGSGIPGQQHTENVQFFILTPRHFIHFSRGNGRAKELFRRSAIRLDVSSQLAVGR